MQLKFPSVSGIEGEGYTYKLIQDTPMSLEFSEIGPGRFQALVPVTHTCDGGDLQSTYPVTIESDTTDAQKSRRRVMIKVTIPYRRAVVDPSTSAVSVGGNSGEISMHLVVSVPKALIQDLTVPDPANPKAAQVASSTMFTVISLLRALSCTLGTNNLKAAVGPSNTNLTDLKSVGSMPDSISRPSDSETRAYQTVQGGFSPVPIAFAVDDISGITRIRSNPGYTSLAGSTKVGLQSLHFDPIVRGLYGLRPIEENSEIAANVTFGDFTWAS